ncbi:hypothetical protein BRARA_G02410, partial [Brassica rapa]
SLPSLHVLILRSNESYGLLYHRHMSIGFQSLRVIDTSHNDFIGNLPSKYFSNWREMNTLTKEKDEIYGKIPDSIGQVPRSTQFQRQKCSSFLGNPGLYGLKDICGGSHVPNPIPKQPKEVSESEEQMFNWIAAAIAYGPGLFCGLVIGYIFTSHNQEWFAEKFGRRNLKVTTIAR